MIDLSEIMTPIDIRIEKGGTGGCYLIVTCRDSLYEQVKKELKDTADVYGIPIQFVGELTAEILNKERSLTDIQLVTWQVGLNSTTLGNKLADYFRSHGLTVYF